MAVGPSPEVKVAGRQMSPANEVADYRVASCFSVEPQDHSHSSVPRRFVDVAGFRVRIVLPKEVLQIRRKHGERPAP